MEIRVIEPIRQMCEVCHEREAVFVPLYEKDGKLCSFLRCRECEMPYPEVKVSIEMDEGYYYTPYVPVEPEFGLGPTP